jgi:hypothetical protein
MYCTKTDQVVVSTASKNTTDLLSLKITLAPTIDGVIVWVVIIYLVLLIKKIVKLGLE